MLEIKSTEQMRSTFDGFISGLYTAEERIAELGILYLTCRKSKMKKSSKKPKEKHTLPIKKQR